MCKNNNIYFDLDDEQCPKLFNSNSYDQYADKAVDNDGATEEIMGIKGHCIFNSMKLYHCTTVMPPCAGQDFIEGVFSYDVQFLLKFIIMKEGLITAEEFNENLKKVQLNKRAAGNGPCSFRVKKLNSKYEGSAGQLSS